MSINRDRSPYLIGNRQIFRLTEENCKRLLKAIVATSTHIYDSDSTSFKDGELLYGVKLHQADAIFSVSVPTDKVWLFNYIMGSPILEQPIELLID